MGLMQRRKGRMAESAFKRILLDRDWTIDADMSAGVRSADLLATDPDGKTWLIEVKSHKILNLPYFEAQARRQAKEAKKPWMLAAKLTGYNAWLITRQGDATVYLWRGKNAENE